MLLVDDNDIVLSRFVVAVYGVMGGSLHDHAYTEAESSKFPQKLDYPAPHAKIRNDIDVLTVPNQVHNQLEELS